MVLRTFPRFAKAPLGWNRIAILGLVLLWVSPLLADEERYSFVGYAKGGTSVERSAYEVIVPIQTGPFRSTDWRNFRDNEAPESVILNIGFGENYSWAATVKAKGTLEEGKDISVYAAETYPAERYSSFNTEGSGNECLISGLIDNNEATYRRFYEYVVLCSHIQTNEIYELLFSEMNLMGHAPSEHFHDAAHQFLRSIEISGT